MPLIASIAYQVLLWLILGICVLSWEILHNRAERRRSLRLGKRAAVQEDEWFGLSVADEPALAPLPRDMVLAVLHALANLIDIQATQLRCSDRIADLYLTETYVTDDAWNYYDEALSELADRYNIAEFLPDPNWTTIGDVIKGTVAQMLGQLNGTGPGTGPIIDKGSQRR